MREENKEIVLLRIIKKEYKIVKREKKSNEG